MTQTAKHLIAGEWTDAASRDPDSLVDRACQAAEAAFWSYGDSTRNDRAPFLEAIADEIDARGEEITAIGCQETALPEARLTGERGRTVGQLRMFAEHVRKGSYLDRRHDEALPDREPLPRPDLRVVQRPIGPVAVFGACNFPLAFSTAGGDTAAALAAGCPVVVKGHEAHPGTAEVVARAIQAAIEVTGMHPGVFSQIQGASHAIGAALVTHPRICAVGFTGSLAGGRALFDLCARRPNPIPFFGELGSVNPVFVLPTALRERATEIARGWAASLTLGVGQFCTNPGIVIIPDTEGAEAFLDAARTALSEVDAQTMLTGGIAEAYRAGCERFAGYDGVQVALESSAGRGQAAPCLFHTSAEHWLRNEDLWEEVFGPMGLVVRARDASQVEDIARALKGQLTVTLHLDEKDTPLAAKLMPILERKAGRVLANGYPTGVEVCDAMVHGGPYPATTNVGHTSVGTLSIRRFLRPVCYQNLPEALLRQELR